MESGSGSESTKSGLGGLIAGGFGSSVTGDSSPPPPTPTGEAGTSSSGAVVAPTQTGGGAKGIIEGLDIRWGVMMVMMIGPVWALQIMGI